MAAKAPCCFSFARSSPCNPLRLMTVDTTWRRREPMTSADVQLDRDVLKYLIEASRASERRFYNASEHVRNRGLKLILKTYVQQRAQFADTLTRLLERAGDEPPTDVDLGGTLSRGWTDVKATMIVRRQVRQQHVLTEVADEEDATLQAYEQALQQPLPDEVQKLIRQQVVEVERVQRRLRQLAGAGDLRILTRLYDDAEEARQVLHRSMKDTILVAGGIGAGIGLVLSGLLALAHRLYFPEIGGILADTPAGVTIELISAGIVIGVLFGVVFGTLMGRDAAEDDTYLYTKSLQQGDTLVAVFTDKDKVSRAEQIVGLRHQFEVEPVAT
ncbi:MAG: hypothetical protein DCC55_22280 [Chloroflexi bacterium]|nr:MAG: hypothetical protein DCC55_22280 [Chloroflexota bacterium]